MSQRFAGGAIGDPVLVILMQVLDAFDDQHEAGERRVDE
jgi:hypothetical protein